LTSVDARPIDRWVEVGDLKLHVRQWDGAGVPFVLLHGLASNCLTWEAVARRLSAAGHPVVTVDQRGHGLSDKPESGYGFDEVSGDLSALIQALRLGDPPIVAGQSWGGHVVLDFAARYPSVPRGIVLVDGGYSEMASRPDATWERISVDLRPPPLAGTPRVDLAARIRRMHPGWTAEGIEATLGNFETMPDGTVRPWLTLERHMLILRALWEHPTASLFPRVTVPVLIAPADSGDAARLASKHAAVTRAETSLPRCRVRWFENTAHDIHVERPDELAELMLASLADGFFGGTAG
jgi:pimeloyl-ACP methyl ester carboxylesterase